MLFKRKHEFKPDKTEASLLSQLHLTKKQRRSFLKWLLVTLFLVLVSVVQDVIFSQVYILGGRLDLVPALLLLACVAQDPEIGSIFLLTGSVFYWCSGSAPGAYIIAVLTLLGVFFGIVRHCYLHQGFGSTWLCAGAAMVLYEGALFAIGVFLGYTDLNRALGFLVCAGLSVAVMPLFYPVVKAICNNGGTTWNE